MGDLDLPSLVTAPWVDNYFHKLILAGPEHQWPKIFLVVFQAILERLPWRRGLEEPLFENWAFLEKKESI